MLDAVNFEILGLPAAAILTDPFRATGFAMAELQGFADYPFATVAHPITSLSADQVNDVADAITPAVEALLLGPAAEPSPDADGAKSLLGLVEELAAGLRSDGADLTASQDGDVVTFTLDIPTQACAECVMPSKMLHAIFQQRVDAELGTGLTVVINDPR